ncbi:hypothetical protein RHGRI_016414 [Rhododendron griersonianum]|uniref:F-box domain-containing protein n=1 Tax=Rhododendron griersonianum TaxID=479676 RepID=A0AAV6JU29_9ERIC|nr:hypothetical protein RHGRI_016414 [Rhododendron griersonianum]
MDPEVWSRLPPDLLDRILSLLPLKTFLRLAPTCKHFQSLTFSPPFISKHTSSPSPFSSFLLCSHPHFHHHRQYPLYDTNLNAWRKASLSLSGPLLSHATLLSVSHGRLCFSLPHSSSFLISNLLSKTSSIVNFPVNPFPFELFTLVPWTNGRHYWLFMLCSSSSGSNNAFVYDSRLQLWRRFDRADSVLGHNSLQTGVFYNGSLNFTALDPLSIICFDLENGSWGKPVRNLPNGLTFARLVGNGDEKMFLVGGIGEDGISRGMKVWELGGNGGGNWVEIESVPEVICRKLMSICYHNYEHVYCFWHKGLICVCCYNWPEVLYYKVSRGSWHWLPKCPSLPEKWSCGFRWFSLVPDLYAFV